MGRPFVLVQLSDPHIGATWAEGDPVAGLAAAIDSILAVRPTPDALLLSGDLADHASDAEYEQVVALLDAVQAPRFALPGNHDDRDALRQHFDAPGAPGAPVQYAADLGPLRLVVTDSTRPGADSGQLDSDRLAWLEDTLAADNATPTILAMHHPPLRTGVPALDAVGLPDADREALSEVVRAHPNLSLIAAGHVHRAIAGRLAGCSVLAAPSIYAGFTLDFTSERAEAIASPPGYVVHALDDGQLASHVMALRVG